MLIQQIIKKDKDKICLIYKDKKITYAQIDKQSDCLASSLPIKKADKVGLSFSDPMQQLVCFFAVIKAGGVGIFLPSDLEKNSFDLMLDDNFSFLDINNNWQNSKQSDEDLFLGVFSSGSTGEPKLILRDHKSWISALNHQSNLFNITEDSILYLIANLSYSANLNALIHAFYVGATVVLSGGKNINLWLYEMQEHNINSLFMVPAYYQMLLKKIKSKNFNVKSIVSGGAKLDVDLAIKLKAKFPNANICQYYGASELGHISYALYDDMIKKPYSVGRLFPQVNINFMDKSIVVQSPYLAYGYAPKAVADDLGYMDDEGYLFLTGRKQEVINIAGVKVALSKIEKIINECPKVNKAVVVKIEDDIRGEASCAFVVKKEEDLTKLELLKYCREFLNANICPQKLVFLKQMPLNANGKIDKIKLKTMVK